jgi:glycerol-3-phosphate acyltransferase PlsY
LIQNQFPIRLPVLALALLLAYALGCFSPGWWLVRRKIGGDLRALGSGVTGATNAARVLGPRTGFLVLALDAAKAALAVLLARWLAPADAWHVLALPAVVAGHIWPAPLRFRGGRGAGPLLGGCLALNPLFALAAGAPAALADALSAASAPRWLWLVHHETSTGVLHDLAHLKSFADQHRLALCLDCMSSVGAIAVDLSNVHLATASSNKGLAALPGLALVFHQDPPQPRADLPRYLDLALWAAANSVPFTHSSNLIAALDIALAEIERLPSGGRCTVDASAAWLRAELTAAGFTVVAPAPHASPIIVTVQLPPSLNSTDVGAHLERRGFLASHQSAYLTARHWIQFCLIGAPSRATLVAELRRLTAPAATIPLPA